MKILPSLILSFTLIGLWSCSDAGKNPVSSVAEEVECTLDLDCNGLCGGSSIEDTCGLCDGDGSTCNISYSITIQPIFTDRCISCHNGSHSTGLDLRSYTGVTSGSTNNQVIISGSQETSLLWQYVNSGYMPPSPNDLTASQIGLIATWVYEGALNN